ncbi:tetranectin-like protein isoform X1 [Genypterus blacodes]|uniref:tetranectin-like protein isoform X1 n=1 Tax=Genypterus blacodes TaxID=154954 RepID=UPI003F75FEE4
MARLTRPFFLLLCLSLLHFSSCRPPRTRKAVSARHSDAAADEEDVKSQLERLWHEVNSLKEMQALQTVCLRGIKANRKCYLTIEEPKHYHEANEDCIAQGGTLATPRDLMENNELRDYAKRSAPASKDFWIGVADIVKEGQYVDVNSMPISFFNWDRSKKQPTGTKRESCVVLSVVAQGKWSDEVCRSLKKYICEYVIP